MATRFNEVPIPYASHTGNFGFSVTFFRGEHVTSRSSPSKTIYSFYLMAWLNNRPCIRLDGEGMRPMRLANIDTQSQMRPRFRENPLPKACV